MRYSILINAVKCQEWGLNLQQGALFDLLNQSISWATPVVVDGEVYHWVSRNMIINEIPLAYTKPDTVYRAFKTLEDKGLIVHVKDGLKDLIRLTDEGKKWNHKESPKGKLLGNKSDFSDDNQNSEINPTLEGKLGNKSDFLPQNSEINPTNKLTINPLTNNKLTNGESDKKSKLINITFDDFWNLYDKKRGDKDKIEKKWQSLKDSEREAIMNHLPLYKKSQPNKKYRKDPSTYLNNKSWNDEIIFDDGQQPVSHDFHPSHIVSAPAIDDAPKLSREEKLARIAQIERGEI